MPIELRVEACPQGWQTPLRELIELEVDALVSEEPSRPMPAPDWVLVRCGVREIQIVVRTRGEDRERRLSREAGRSETMQRIIALVAAELVYNAPAEPVVQPPAAEPDVVAPKPAPKPTDSAFFMLGLIRGWGQPLALGAGIAVGYEQRLSSPWRLHLDATAMRTQTSVPVATVQVLGASLGSFALYTSQAGRWVLALGPGLRLGWAQLEGTPTLAGEGRRLNGAWGGPALAAWSRLRAGNKLLVSLGAEAGWVALPVSGVVENDGRPVFAIEDFWVQGALGISALF